MQPPADDLIVGFCRFSCLGRSDWSAIRKNPDKSALSDADWQNRAALLYDDARMAARFAAFETFCLPSIRAQDDPWFRFHVLISPEMPPHWRDRLLALCAPVPQIRVTPLNGREIETALTPLLAELQAKAARNLIQFRLDDDDALALGAVTRMRNHAARLADLANFGVSFGNSLSVAIYPGQPVIGLQHKEAFLSASTVVRLSDPLQSVFSIAHARVPLRLTHLVDREGIGALALKWPSDSRALDLDNLPPEVRILKDPALRREIARWFPWLKDVDFQDFSRMVASAHDALIAPSWPGFHPPPQSS